MLNIIAALIQTALLTLNKVSQPSSTHIKDKQDFDLAHNRNKALILINLSASISFLLNLHLGIGKPTSNMQGLFGATFIITALLVTTWLNLHPLVFKIIFNLYALSFGFLLINNGEHGIIGTAVTAPLIPLVVYFLTGSIRGFIFNIICEIIFMNVFCEKIMQKNLIQLSIEDTTRALVDFANQNFVYSFIYTAFIHYIIQNALYKIRQAEKKKDDFEKQKNFLLGFSHELRNLINSLMGNVKLASLENLPEKAKELLLNAEVCAEMLLHLVNNILDTGKVEIGELEITPVPTKVYDTIERIWSICSELIKRKNLRGTMKIHKHIPQLLTLDHYRIAQLFLNLIGNAVKYTDTGSVDVSVEWIDDIQAVNETCFEPFPYNYSDDDEGLFEKNRAVSIINHDFIILSSSRKKINRKLLARRANDKPGMLKISVSDTGCGILEEETDILFHRFTQGSSDPSKKKLGTGLGLFITKELCQKMNGDVKVFSKRGSGSTFIVCLPIQPVTKEQASSFELQDMQRISNYYKNLRAMVVDDEQFSHLILRNYLTKLHVEVVDVAENGLISYEMYKDRVARKDSVNIVTMDIQMPVMDGKTAAQKIREFEVANDVTPCLLVVVSGNCTESEIKECLDKNGNIRADAFVKKPVSVDELNRIITYHFAQASCSQSVSVLHG